MIFVILSFSFLFNPRIACLCAPTLFKKLLEIKPVGCEAKIFEFDRRFNVFGEDFVFYDYNKPLDLPDSITECSFDVVFADPPFLSEECLTKTAQTMKYLAKERIILCTGKYNIMIPLLVLIHSCQLFLSQMHEIFVLL